MDQIEIKKQIQDALELVIDQRKDDPKSAYWAILHVIVKDNYYIQFMADFDNEIRVEISGKHYESKRFSDDQIKIVDKYGYKYPDKSMPNFYKMADLTTISIESIRDEIFDLLVNVLDLKDNLPLKIEFECEKNSGGDTWLRKFIRKIRKGKPIVLMMKEDDDTYRRTKRK